MNENEKNERIMKKMIFKFTQQNDMKIQIRMKMKKMIFFFDGLRV